MKIDRASVARNIPDTQIEQTKIRTVRDKLLAKAGANASLSAGGILAAVKGSASLERELKDDDELKIVQALPPILAVCEPRSSQEYSWTLEPTFMRELKGQPWDPIDYPRLAARYDFSKIGVIEPVIHARLDCALEDVVIDDIQPKDATLLDKVASLLPGDTRLVAAKQHLKQIMKVAHLEPGEMDNRFSSLMIATVLATVEG